MLGALVNSRYQQCQLVQCHLVQLPNYVQLPKFARGGTDLERENPGGG